MNLKEGLFAFFAHCIWDKEPVLCATVEFSKCVVMTEGLVTWMSDHADKLVIFSPFFHIDFEIFRKTDAFSEQDWFTSQWVNAELFEMQRKDFLNIR